MTEWWIRHILFNAYRSQSQGVLKRHHQTLKTMLKAFCMNHENRDEDAPYVMYAVRETPTTSLGFSPNQLVFGHRIRVPLDVFR